MVGRAIAPVTVRQIAMANDPRRRLTASEPVQASPLAEDRGTVQKGQTSVADGREGR
jgi:hypothetical protein